MLRWLTRSDYRNGGERRGKLVMQVWDHQVNLKFGGHQISPGHSDTVREREGENTALAYTV
jgi:hypothetical protein